MNSNSNVSNVYYFYKKFIILRLTFLISSNLFFLRLSSSTWFLERMMTALLLFALFGVVFSTDTLSSRLKKTLDNMWRTPPPPPNYKPDPSEKYPLPVDFILLYLLNIGICVFVKIIRHFDRLSMVGLFVLYLVFIHLFGCFFSYARDLTKHVIRPLGEGYDASTYCGSTTGYVPVTNTSAEVDFLEEFFPNISASLIGIDALTVVIVSVLCMHVLNQQYNLPCGNILAALGLTGLTFPFFCYDDGV